MSYSRTFAVTVQVTINLESGKRGSPVDVGFAHERFAALIQEAWSANGHGIVTKNTMFNPEITKVELLSKEK